MPKRIENIEIDLDKVSTSTRFTAKQYEDIELVISLINDGVAYDASNCVISLHCNKQIVSSISIENGKLIVIIASESLIESGLYECELSIVDDNGTLKTPSFYFNISTSLSGEIIINAGQVLDAEGYTLEDAEGYTLEVVGNKVLKYTAAEIDGAILKVKNMPAEGIVGPKGDKGEQGIQGVPGIQGPKGDPGANGTFDKTTQFSELNTSAKDIPGAINENASQIAEITQDFNDHIANHPSGGVVEIKQLDMMDNVMYTDFLGNGTTTIISQSVTINTINGTNVQIGETLILTATVLPTDTTNKNVMWTSSNTNVATISTGGIVTGVSKGTCNITCEAYDNASSTNMVTITVSEEQIPVNESYFMPRAETLNISVLDENTQGTAKFIWKELPICKITKFYFFTGYSRNSKIGFGLAKITGENKITLFKKYDFPTGNSGDSDRLIEYSVDVDITETGVYPVFYGNMRYRNANTTEYIPYGSLADNFVTTITESNIAVNTEYDINPIKHTSCYACNLLINTSTSTLSLQDISSMNSYDNISPMSINPSEFIYENCIPNQGLLCQGQTMTYWDKYSAYDTFTMRSKFKLGSTNAVFGLMFKGSDDGGFYKVNLQTQKLILTKNFNGNYEQTIQNPLTEIKTTDITIDINTNDDYIIEVIKDNRTHRLNLINVQKGTSNTVFYDNCNNETYNQQVSNCYGSPGIITLEGDITFKSFSFNVSNFKQPKALILGDSITDGGGMGGGIDGKYKYSALIRDNIYKGKALICGRGGDMAYGAFQRLQTIFSLGSKPEIVIVAIGTNDLSTGGTGAYTAWEQYITEMYNLIKANNAIPVFCVPPLCYNDRPATTITKMKNYLISKNYNVIRMDIATSVDRDGITIDDSMFYNGGIHPNQKGHNLMFEQAKLELGNLI